MRKFFNTLKSRCRNYGFCLSFLALIPVTCQMFDIPLPKSEYEVFTNALLTFLVAAGIVSNPTTSNKWYIDDKEYREQG